MTQPSPVQPDSCSPQRLIVLSGPSGVGKGTLCKMLLQSLPQLSWSVSATTRAMRDGEVDGKDYYFLDKAGFMRQVEAGDFIEWAEFAGACYGTLKSEIGRLNASEKIPLIEIDVQGALQIQQQMPQALFIFIAPPSIAELKERLLKRGQNTLVDMANRLVIAEQELQYSHHFTVTLINNTLPETHNQLVETITGYLSQPLQGEACHAE